MASDTFHGLFLDELRDIYSAEKQLLKALPKMAKAADHAKLKQGFLDHLKQTQGHVARLEKIFSNLDAKATGKTCHAMQGLVEEGAEAMAEGERGSIRDVQLIGAAQRVEHYEIAAYGTVLAMAELMGHRPEAKLLKQTLGEESATDKKLTQLSGRINSTAFRQHPGM